MSDKEYGGNAFPTMSVHSTHSDSPPFEQTGIESESIEGMTLRDYFAAKAMAALIVRNKFTIGMGEDHEATQAASKAVFFADQLLKALKK